MGLITEMMCKHTINNIQEQNINNNFDNNISHKIYKNEIICEYNIKKKIIYKF